MPFLAAIDFVKAGLFIIAHTKEIYLLISGVMDIIRLVEDSKKQDKKAEIYCAVKDAINGCRSDSQK